MEAFTLVGVDGNAFSVMAYVSKAMKTANYTKQEIENYRKLCMSGDYNHLLALSMEWLDKCNEVLGLEEDDEEDEYDEEEIEW